MFGGIQTCPWMVGKSHFQVIQSDLGPNFRAKKGPPFGESKGHLQEAGLGNLYMFIYYVILSFSPKCFKLLCRIWYLENNAFKKNIKLGFPETLLGWLVFSWGEGGIFCLKQCYWKLKINYMCQGLTSHYFHIIGDKLINPISVGVKIGPHEIRIPSFIKGGRSRLSPTKRDNLDHGTYRVASRVRYLASPGSRLVVYLPLYWCWPKNRVFWPPKSSHFNRGFPLF